MGNAPGHAAAQSSWRGWLLSAWRGFNHWRRRYWLVRVIILLVIFAPSIIEVLSGQMLITWLVRIAIQSIRFTYEPPATYNLARFYRAEEAKRLQIALWRELDANKNNVLDDAEKARAVEIGLAPEQLTTSPREADLRQLGQAAKRLELVPLSYSTTRVYRQAWDAAQAETKRMTDPGHKEVDRLLAQSVQWPDYTKWDTWKEGIHMFLGGIFGWFGGPREAAMWFLICFLAAGTGSLLFTRSRPLAGFFLGLPLVVVPIIVLRIYPWYWYYPSYGWGGEFWKDYWWLRWAGYALLTAAVGHLGGRAACRVKRRLQGALWGIILLGVVIAASSALAGFGTRLHCFLCGIHIRYMRVPGLLSWDLRSVWLSLILIGVGAIGLALAYKPHKPSEIPGEDKR